MQKFLSNPGKESRVHVAAGDFYASIGDLSDALDHYRSGSSEKNDRLICQNRIARVLLLQKKRQEGLQVLNQTLTQFPEDPEARALRAALLVGEPGAGKPGEGIQELRAVLEKESGRSVPQVSAGARALPRAKTCRGAFALARNRQVAPPVPGGLHPVSGYRLQTTRYARDGANRRKPRWR